MFFRTCGPNLLVEFECFSGQVSAHVEQYQVIHIGLPEKSRPGEILGRVYLDAMTLQNPDPHVARRLVTIYEENRLALKNWLATKWRRAIHTPPPERGAQLGRIVLPQDAGVKGNGKAPLVGAFVNWSVPGHEFCVIGSRVFREMWVSDFAWCRGSVLVWGCGEWGLRGVWVLWAG